MPILFLGPETSPLLPWLRNRETHVFQDDSRISPQFITENQITFIVSYGYRHKIEQPILDAVAGQAVNLHISYLPWNRGADPNFWSFVDDTPKGVSIHYINDGIDTGDIIAQRLVTFDSNKETLASSYAKLQAEIQDLFRTHWHDIKVGICSRQAQQPSEGSHHYARDKSLLEHLLTKGWDTPVSALRENPIRTRG